MGVLSIEIVTAGFSLENYQYVFYVAKWRLRQASGPAAPAFWDFGLHSNLIALN
jgi:hypothetical protein